MKDIIKKTVTYILIGILIIVLSILIYCFIEMKIKNKKYINIFGYTAFEVITGSMSGTIEKNDIIIVKITKDVKKGDIISFEQDNVIITHRIIEEENNNLVTKGDSNNSEDKPISKDDVIGKVVKSFSKLGIWLKVFSNKIVLISVFTTLLFFSFVISFDSKNKKI